MGIFLLVYGRVVISVFGTLSSEGLHAVFEDGSADSLSAVATTHSAGAAAAPVSAPAAPATPKTGKKYEVVGGADKAHKLGRWC